MKKRFILIVPAFIILLSTFVCVGLSTSALYDKIDEYQNNKSDVHQIAEIARSLGCDESNPIIKEASRLWFEYYSLEISCRQELASVESQELALNQFLADNAQNAKDMAGVMYAESRGLSAYEMSMICWCILNRYDTQRYGETLHSVIWAKSQFAHSTRTVSDNGTDLVWLANDVLSRWYREQQGEVEVGRTLPQGYCFYYGDGYHNNFRMKNSGKGYHNFGLWNPYQ